ncbi:MAG: glucose-1-phosphate cytidylyltransferase [Chitinivibrionales bacterium]|nr:glucose-1-phosphate cytidylyltransferase [Chitinivibrionales bacterium]
MKVGILAGGLGSRLQEETTIRPKPMVEIGGYPILWHIMKIYAAYGFREFVLALGYKGKVIKDYFLNYRYQMSDFTIETGTGNITMHHRESENWTVHLLNTGLKTETGGRIKQIAQFIGNETFMLTYGDGVSNVDIQKLVKFHHAQKKLVTVTAVRPPARFGNIILTENFVSCFEEKPQAGEGWINGGFFVIEPAVAKYIVNDSTIFEREPLENLAADGQLAAYRHDGFWQCMDTLRDVRLLESLWQKGQAEWRVW